MNKDEKLELYSQIWEGCHTWSKKAFIHGWIKKSEWYDEHELASSIFEYIDQETKLEKQLNLHEEDKK